MEVCPDYENLFKQLNIYKVKYLVVGAHAVIFYSQPRYTKDIDIWASPDPDNAQRIHQALKKFGAPLENVLPQDFTNKKMIYQIGVEPVRIDILLDIAGIPFRKAWKNKISTKYGKTSVHVLGLPELIKAKKFSHRDTDLVDLKKLLIKVNKKRN
ncbi:MAG: hypothetical protein A3I11_06105 [Elusimicrobia bacterium RIFCSPLOWO2_02_FULL_39_32]|nr:MAG: hypothetical protein A2034_01465 [Elusimicrobia bacterium GWA2_38_7]OGR80937.1 MAG: hypothetical protein A3B80_04640 [Elusimicrobia bacterium RIFCSPHIGHO2_02_FULL_39_36]OGR91644.1 MAG: hypothetical protein A3I11_06105 [Elusimicrobia bacterium RIFCSPLOWO2_02_FULL_39_32]OGS00895.1 MAG: hypothetical protein A3G85_00230 [Elusimicrobia bacterium RIFCSPLOWO2_12_FULL_39_28]